MTSQPKFKLILMSATINETKFQNYFASRYGQAVLLKIPVSYVNSPVPFFNTTVLFKNPLFKNPFKSITMPIPEAVFDPIPKKNNFKIEY